MEASRRVGQHAPSCKTSKAFAALGDVALRNGTLLVAGANLFPLALGPTSASDSDNAVRHKLNAQDASAFGALHFAHSRRLVTLLKRAFPTAKLHAVIATKALTRPPCVLCGVVTPSALSHRRAAYTG
jgi:hypothetical protein